MGEDEGTDLRAPAPAAAAASGSPETQLHYSDQSIHAVIAQQVQAMLGRTDLSEEEKQAILVALQCPCCGAGGLSLSIKLKD